MPMKISLTRVSTSAKAGPFGPAVEPSWSYACTDFVDPKVHHRLTQTWPYSQLMTYPIAPLDVLPNPTAF